MLFALLTPLGRTGRRHWGIDAQTAERSYPGDELGPAVLEPVGFAMDRRMLLGIKERAELSQKPASARP